MNPVKPFIVGIDIGSCLIKVCYKTRNGEIQDYSFWLDFTNRSKTAAVGFTSHVARSRLYFPPPNIKIPIWQEKLDEAEVDLEEFDHSRVVYNWKGGLHSDSTFFESIAAKAESLGIRVEDFPFHMTRLLLTNLFAENGPLMRIIKNDSCDIEDVCLVFGKPSSWNVASYLPIQLAAEAAGFGRHQIKLVSETEAFFRQYIKYPVEPLKAGNVIVSIDCGGHTIDIDAHRILELAKKEVPASSTSVESVGLLPLSLTLGSETIWPAAEQRFRNILEERGDYSAYDYIVAGGGYSSVAYLEERLRALGKELKVQVVMHPVFKPVAEGAVDMADDPTLIQSRVLKTSYSILTDYRWKPPPSKEKRLESKQLCNPYRDTNAQGDIWYHARYDWLGKEGDVVGLTQSWSAEKPTLRKNDSRTRHIRNRDDLCWTETFQIWEGHPGHKPSSLPKKLAKKNMRLQKEFSLTIDFREKITDHEAQLKKDAESLKRQLHYIAYRIVMKLDGEIASFVVQSMDKNGVVHSVVLDEPFSVNITTIEERGDCPRNIEVISPPPEQVKKEFRMFQTARQLGMISSPPENNKEELPALLTTRHHEVVSTPAPKIKEEPPSSATVRALSESPNQQLHLEAAKGQAEGKNLYNNDGSEDELASNLFDDLPEFSNLTL